MLINTPYVLNISGKGVDITEIPGIYQVPRRTETSNKFWNWHGQHVEILTFLNKIHIKLAKMSHLKRKAAIRTMSEHKRIQSYICRLYIHVIRTPNFKKEWIQNLVWRGDTLRV